MKRTIKKLVWLKAAAVVFILMLSVNVMAQSSLTLNKSTDKGETIEHIIDVSNMDAKTATSLDAIKGNVPPFNPNLKFNTYVVDQKNATLTVDLDKGVMDKDQLVKYLQSQLNFELSK